MLPATVVLQAHLRSSSRSDAPTDLFSVPAHPIEHPTDGGVAHRNPRHPRQELAPFGQRRRRPFFEVRLQELPRRLAQLGFRAGAPLGGEWLPFACGGSVALDAREAHAEGPGNLGGRHAPFFGCDDLLPQVQRVGVHASILPHRPTTLQSALAGMRRPYPTDLSDAEWNYIEPHMPAPKGHGRPRTHSLREILNAVFYVLKSGCQWRLLPHDFPRWPTVYHYFRAWRIDGTWERINRAIRERLRLPLKRDPQH